jgi:hypothetical protein
VFMRSTVALYSSARPGDGHPNPVTATRRGGGPLRGFHEGVQDAVRGGM